MPRAKRFQQALMHLFTTLRCITAERSKIEVY
jgi:hypothetical protein